MKVLLVASKTKSASAGVMLEAAAPAWQERADVTLAPVSDGEGDLCDVLFELTKGELGVVDADGSPVPVHSKDGAWTIDVSDAWGEDSTNLGLALDQVLAELPSMLTINLPRQVPPDMGRGMMTALGVQDESGLAQRLASTHLLVTSSSEQPLLGVNGLPRWLDRHGLLSPMDAQDLERHLGGNLPASVRPSLLPGGMDAKSPTSGLGGGCGLLFEAIGARFAWAGDIVVRELERSIPESDLVVYVTGDIGLDLPRSLFALSREAEEHAIPVVVIYGGGRLQRHELARFGLSGSYSYAAAGGDVDGLRHAMVAIAQTWAR
ncbi:glycerate kinase [Flaviflexus massiliensis]|uniref:glycerate kinase n=1 Tax=Flaviflexus massiliensis TaxID=1522309 RepID=UPI0006D53D41|nr:glycerate kinase [Flaviflexus massiliensis]